MTKKLERYLFLIIFIAGYISLSVELVVIRQLGIFVGSTAVITSIIIGVFLSFLTLGYYKGTALEFNRYSAREIMGRGFFISSIFILFGCSYILLDLFFSLMVEITLYQNIVQTFIYCLIFLSLPPFLFGYIVSISSRYLDRCGNNYTGKIMAVDTIGSVLGSLLTTLVLMPFIGVNNTVIFLIAICMIGYILTAKRVRILKLFLSVVLALMLNSSGALRDLYDIVENNAVSTIALKSADEGKSTLMLLNRGHSSKVTEDDALRFNYVAYIEDIFLKTLPRDRKHKILILGAGGFTMGHHDAFNEYTYVDIDASLLKIAEEQFLKEKLTDNKKFVVQDATQFLKIDQQYDLIVMDTYSTMAMIPAQLLTQEYFERIKSRLAPGGIVAMNLISSANFSDPFAINLDETLRSVFPHLHRQILGEFNPWESEFTRRNIIYVYYQKSDRPATVYTNDKNQSFYDIYRR